MRKYWYIVSKFIKVTLFFKPSKAIRLARKDRRDDIISTSMYLSKTIDVYKIFPTKEKESLESSDSEEESFKQIYCLYVSLLVHKVMEKCVLLKNFDYKEVV